MNKLISFVVFVVGGLTVKLAANCLGGAIVIGTRDVVKPNDPLSHTLAFILPFGILFGGVVLLIAGLKFIDELHSEWVGKGDGWRERSWGETSPEKEEEDWFAEGERQEQEEAAPSSQEGEGESR